MTPRQNDDVIERHPAPGHGFQSIFRDVVRVMADGLGEGLKVSYEVQADRRSGKESATNLKIA